MFTDIAWHKIHSNTCRQGSAWFSELASHHRTFLYKRQEVGREKPQKSYAKQVVIVESLSPNFMKNSSSGKFYKLTKLSGVNLNREKILYLMLHLSGSTSKKEYTLNLRKRFATNFKL